MASKRPHNLGWLMATLSSQRQKISSLWGRLTDIGTPGYIKPSQLNNFFNMLDEIAAQKQEELRLLDEIQAVEQQHRFHRDSGTLKTTKDRKAEPVAEGEKPKRGWSWGFALWLFLMSQAGISQKKQTLTAD